MIGCCGGLIGALFNATNEKITLWRMARINHSKRRRCIEVLVLTSIVTTVSFLMPAIWGRCTELPQDMQDWSNQGECAVSHPIAITIVIVIVVVIVIEI